MKVTLHTADPIIFDPPVLVDLGPERAELAGENSTIMVYLDNARGTVTEALADPPLRTRVTVERSATTIEGVLQAVSLAEQAVLRIET